MDVAEALEHASGLDRIAYPNEMFGPGTLKDFAAIRALAAELRVAHATIARMVAEREALEVELAKWRR